MPELRVRITERLAELQREGELGEERLIALENEAVVLRQTLLRIGGAMQVLRELTAGSDADELTDRAGADR